MTEKFCTKCGKKFMAIGRQVICPDCKAAAEEDAKRAAVMKAKKASWTGESVPVRISGKASAFIREYSKEKNLAFAQALDELLKTSDYFKKLGIKWENIIPYKSRRRDKSTATSTAVSKPQDAQKAPQEVKQAAKTSASKTTSKAVKTSTSKAAGKGGKA